MIKNRRLNEIHMNLPFIHKSPDAVAIDLDGTLLNSQTQLSDRNRGAIEKCLTSGIPVIIATSRPARSVRRILGPKMMEACSLVLQNGAISLAAPPFSRYIKESLTPELARNIVTLILSIESEMRITVELEGYEFGTNRPRDLDELWEVNSATPDMQLSLEAALPDNPTKIAAGGLGRDLSEVASAITQRFNDAVSVVPANEMTFLNIISIKASKPEALRRILGSKQLSLDNVMAFGDDIPDIDMLAACGIPIAVANAVPEVKAVTDYHTESNDKDGVAVALEKMLGSLL